MRDFWAFLLQTLTASGTAVLMLTVKAMFRDKLSPRWQFASWGILAAVLLVPAGMDGRYALVNWPMYVELWKSLLTGEFGSLTSVYAPVPLLPVGKPESVTDWLFFVYAAGVVFFLARYMIAYVRLRSVLRGGKPVECPKMQSVAEEYWLPVCRAVEVPGLPSAFVCGVFRPVLALPDRADVDEKVLLHELLHLKYHDVFWGIVICLFRCLHWCNPLLWYCANLAGNDLEALCDHRVLEHLAGEERRDYGRILLSMADEKYARAPGTSSMANGGRNIRKRIESIVRFKKYPRGMALASVCIVLALAVPLAVGTKAEALLEGYPWKVETGTAMMASARTVRCGTYAGALDTYAKAVLRENTCYRAMCAPLEEQDALAEMYREKMRTGGDSWGNYCWKDCGLPQYAEVSSGYQIYNLMPVDNGAYEGLVVVQLRYSPETGVQGGPGCWLAVQKVRTEMQDGRWVVLPQEEFRFVHSEMDRLYSYAEDESLPARVYEAETGDFTVRARVWTSAWADSVTVHQNGLFSTTDFDSLPKPNTDFSSYYSHEISAIYTGDPAEKEQYTHIAASCAAVWDGADRPDLYMMYPLDWNSDLAREDSSGSSSDGSSWSRKKLEPDWESPVPLGGGGSSGEDRMPDCIAVDLYLNRNLAAELTLLPVEGDGSRDGL